MMQIFLKENGLTISFASSRDPDQTPRSVASDLDLHCLPVTRLGVSSLQWVKFSPVDSTMFLYANNIFLSDCKVLYALAIRLGMYGNYLTCLNIQCRPGLNITLRTRLFSTVTINTFFYKSMSQGATKSTIRLVRPAKTQISLRIRAVW